MGSLLQHPRLSPDSERMTRAPRKVQKTARSPGTPVPELNCLFAVQEPSEQKWNANSDDDITPEDILQIPPSVREPDAETKRQFSAHQTARITKNRAATLNTRNIGD
jgi:hypothetical protein